MANWNYRVIRKTCPRTGLVTFQVHEVYYTESGGIDCWTQEAVEPLGTNEAQLRNDVHAFLAAFRKPVLEEKMVLGQLQLIEEKLPNLPPQIDLRREYKTRVSRAAGYLFQMLGNHLLLKQNPALGEAYGKVDQALTELADAVEATTPAVKQNVG